MKWILRLALFLTVLWFSPSASAQVALCFGDGTGTPCPCGNSGSAGNGCANSVNASGGNLTGTGTFRVSTDTFTLVGTLMPNGQTLYFQGTATIAGGLGMVFNDGLLCVTGTIVRLGVKTNVGGASQYPQGGDPSISVKGGVMAGDVRYYQAYYRDSAVFCTAATSNMTEVICVTWTP